MAVVYADAIRAVAAWINSRTTTLVGDGYPLQKGAHFKHLDGAAAACYALLEAAPAYLGGGAESPDMMAQINAQVYGGTLEAATAAAVALAEEIATQLTGVPATAGGALLMVADDISGPTYAPDGDFPRLLVTFTVCLRPV